MNLARYAPHRLRARYLRALQLLPGPTPARKPAPEVGPGLVDPRHLTVLGRAWISRRRLIFGTCTDAPRLWVAFHDPHPGAEPSMLGYFTGLVTDEIGLHVCNDDHRAWASEDDRTERLEQAAACIWAHCQRQCEG